MTCVLLMKEYSAARPIPPVQYTKNSTKLSFLSGHSLPEDPGREKRCRPFRADTARAVPGAGGNVRQARRAGVRGKRCPPEGPEGKTSGKRVEILIRTRCSMKERQWGQPARASTSRGA